MATEGRYWEAVPTYSAMSAPHKYTSVDMAAIAGSGPTMEEGALNIVPTRPFLSKATRQMPFAIPEKAMPALASGHDGGQRLRTGDTET